MNWDALGAIAELLGAIAVFLTLAYLTVQVRQNSKALDLQNQFSAAQIMQARTDSEISLTAISLSNPDNLEILRRMQGEDFDLALLEKENLKNRAPLMMGLICAYFENLFAQYQNGFLDQNFYEGATLSLIKQFGPTLLSSGIPMSTAFKTEVLRVIALP